jgi:hypothetical protein
LIRRSWGSGTPIVIFMNLWHRPSCFSQPSNFKWFLNQPCSWHDNLVCIRRNICHL